MRHFRLKTGNEGWLTSYADLITNLLIFFVLIISASSIQTGKMEKIIAQISQQKPATESLSSAEKKVKEALKEEKLTENVHVKLTDAGLELSFESGVTFASGSEAILAQMEEPLAKVLKVLTPYAGKYNFAVEGHTDETPISSGRFKSNWELSSARAMQVRERLETVGVEKHRIRVEAYGETKALDPETLNGLTRDQVLAKHRRVVVRLY